MATKEELIEQLRGMLEPGESVTVEGPVRTWGGMTEHELMSYAALDYLSATRAVAEEAYRRGQAAAAPAVEMPEGYMVIGDGSLTDGSGRTIACNVDEHGYFYLHSVCANSDVQALYVWLHMRAQRGEL